LGGAAGAAVASDSAAIKIVVAAFMGTEESNIEQGISNVEGG
jgi:hypothetical protein